MGAFRILSASRQTAEHLRTQLLSARWSGTMPGEDRLIAELGVGKATVKAALRHLEDEGLLVPQGPGRRRLIELPEDCAPPALRIAMLLYEPEDRQLHYLLELQHQLREAGHTAVAAPKTLTELKMDVKNVRKLVPTVKADAWVVAGGSRPVLEWFAGGQLPVFGLFGRIVHVPIASTSPRKTPALQALVRRLVSLGHRRIVMLAREERRKPQPGFIEQAFLDELKAQGIPTGQYNLPYWDETPQGLHRILDSLFQHSPPTALLTDTAPVTFAVFQYFSERGLRAPRDVSLACMDPDPVFTWCQPTVSHIAWDTAPIVRRIVRWANNIAVGKDDRLKHSTLASFVEGGTLGSATT